MINLIEYNWGLPGIAGSADQVLAGKDASERVRFDLGAMFRFTRPRDNRVILDPFTGEVLHRYRVPKPCHKGRRGWCGD